MIESIAKYVGGKVLIAILSVAAVIVIIWYWRLQPNERAELWSLARGALEWAAFVAVLPWAFFFVPARVVRAESNWVSAAALAGYLLVDVVFALYLAGGHVRTRFELAAMVVGFLCAAVYNFLVCEFLAARSEDST